MRRGTENEDRNEKQLQRLLWVLSAATFLIFFQAYMVAPLIPRLSEIFGVSSQRIGLIVPAYMIPYGVSTLFYGLFSDHLGRWRIMRVSLVAFLVLTALTATAQSASQMILWRTASGLGGSGVASLALAVRPSHCSLELSPISVGRSGEDRRWNSTSSFSSLGSASAACCSEKPFGWALAQPWESLAESNWWLP